MEMEFPINDRIRCEELDGWCGVKTFLAGSGFNARGSDGQQLSKVWVSTMVRGGGEYRGLPSTSSSKYSQMVVVFHMVMDTPTIGLRTIEATTLCSTPI